MFFVFPSLGWFSNFMQFNFFWFLFVNWLERIAFDLGQHVHVAHHGRSSWSLGVLCYDRWWWTILLPDATYQPDQPTTLWSTSFTSFSPNFCSPALPPVFAGVTLRFRVWCTLRILSKDQHSLSLWFNHWSFQPLGVGSWMVLGARPPEGSEFDYVWSFKFSRLGARRWLLASCSHVNICQYFLVCCWSNGEVFAHPSSSRVPSIQWLAWPTTRVLTAWDTTRPLAEWARSGTALMSLGLGNSSCGDSNQISADSG